MKKTGVILVNVGSPESVSVKDVRNFLSKFLGDKRVIDMPWLLRKMLVNGIIVPFRAPKSAKLYQKLWTDEGSPLIVNGNKAAKKLQAKLGDTYKVFSAMRYGNPSLQNALDTCIENSYKKIIVLPLFPQYASSTTGSVFEYCSQYLQKIKKHPSVSLVSQFYSNPLFINAFVHNIKQHNLSEYDHILFSYHGLPLNQVHDSHNGETCDKYNCTTEINTDNHLCYQATCYATTRLIAEKLQLPDNRYTVCFQSRFAKKWLSPFADAVIREKAKSGAKRLLVVSPAFVADCLETIVEIGTDYQEIFE